MKWRWQRCAREPSEAILWETKEKQMAVTRPVFTPIEDTLFLTLCSRPLENGLPHPIIGDTMAPHRAEPPLVALLGSDDRGMYRRRPFGATGVRRNGSQTRRRDSSGVPR